MTKGEKLGLRLLMEQAKANIDAAREKVSELRVAAKAIGEDGRYVVYDAEDVSYGLRRLSSDLGEGIANLEQEEYDAQQS